MPELEEAEGIVGRVARLEREVAELKKVLGVGEEADPIAESTAVFVAANRAKARVGVKAPRRSGSG